MQAITTKYLGATNTLGSRIKATSESGESLTISYDYSVDNSHIPAIKALKDKLGWDGKMVVGGTKDGYVAVFIKGSEVVS